MSPPTVTVPAPVCSPTTGAVLSDRQTEGLARRMKAVADPTRLRLLSLVSAQEREGACVCDLTAPVGLSQPTVSHHLKILVEAGLLTRDKQGVWAYYHLVPAALEALAEELRHTGRLT